MIVFGVQWEDDRFRKACGKMPKEIFRAFKLLIAKYLAQFRGLVSRQRLRGLPGLRRRTGLLTQSQKAVVTGDSVRSLVGTYAIGGGLVKYARIHEEGGVIRPVRSQFLAIPLEAAKTAAGVSRAVSPRDFQNTFVRNGIIWQKLSGQQAAQRSTQDRNAAGRFVRRGAALAGAASQLSDRSTIVPLFLLRRSVKIEPRLGIKDTWQADRPRRTEFFRAAIAEAIRRAGL